MPNCSLRTGERGEREGGEREGGERAGEVSRAFCARRGEERREDSVCTDDVGSPPRVCGGRSACDRSHALVAGPLSPPWPLWQRATRPSGWTPRPSSPTFATVPFTSTPSAIVH